MRYLSILLVLLLLFVVACNPASPDQSLKDNPAEGDLISRITSPDIEVDEDAIPPVDRSKAIVPAEEILFDTFRSYDRVVPLSEADEGMILRLRDAIPPIYNPKFETGESARWLSEKDLVLGYAQGDVAVAYPIKILNWHEIVSHDIDGVPILATY